MVKRTIMPRFERGVPGSNPGRGTANGLVVQRPGQLPDVEKIGGSRPPATTTRAGDECPLEREAALQAAWVSSILTVSTATEGPPDWRRDPVGSRPSCNTPCGFDSCPFRWSRNCKLQI